jgi:hypothetical protein
MHRDMIYYLINMKKKKLKININKNIQLNLLNKQIHFI